MKKLLLILMAFVAMSASAQALKGRKKEIGHRMTVVDLPKADLSLPVKNVAGFQQPGLPAIQLATPNHSGKRALAPMKKALGDIAYYSMVTGYLDDGTDENGQPTTVEAVHDGVMVGLMDLGDSIAALNLFEFSFQNWGLAPMAKKTGEGFTFNHEEVWGSLGEEGNLTVHIGVVEDVVGQTVIMGDAEFVMDEEGYLMLKGSDTEMVELMMYVADENGSFQGYVDYLWATLLIPESLLGDIIPMPDNAEEYLFTYRIGTDGTTQRVKGKVAKEVWVDEDGDAHTVVYVQGLAPYSNGVVYGFEQGKSLYIMSGLNLGSVGAQYLQFAAAMPQVNEGTGETELVDPGYVVFTQGSDGTYTQESGVYMTEQSPWGYVMVSASSGVTFAPYAGDVLAKPKAAYDLEIVEAQLNDKEKTPVDLLFFMAEYEGTNGEFLNPANLYYEIWMDGECNEFTAEDYPYDEEVVARGNTVPYLYDGNYLGLGGSIYERAVAVFGLYERVGVRMVYCCYGEERYSDIVYVNSFDGSITTEDGIGTVLRPSEKPVSYYDLQGRRLARIPAKGLFVKDGKKVLK